MNTNVILTLNPGQRSDRGNEVNKILRPDSGPRRMPGGECRRLRGLPRHWPGSRMTLLLCVALLATSVAQAKGTILLRLHKQTLVTEVAATRKERAKGLMFRKTLPPDHGMIFVYPNDSIRHFWMKNTSIPLDIAFLDKNGILLTLKQMPPLSTSLISSEKPARYALEVNAGTFKKIQMHPGEKISLPPFSSRSN